MKFGSAIEEARYRELELMERAGLIRGLRRPKRGDYPIVSAITDWQGEQLPALVYTPDSEYFDIQLGRLVVEDVKALRIDRQGKCHTPTMTQAVELRMAVFRRAYPDICLRVEYRESRRNRR